MHIWVKLLSGEQVDVTVEQENTVLQLKQNIQARLGKASFFE